jgi:pyruvate dehydrogenase E2 component (dihydrolipoamide acetyltransferase)
MPALSQTTDEVRFIRWLVHEGDSVKKGDPICEVETDKTMMEVESFESGTVLKLFSEPEEEVSAGTVIALLGRAGEKIPAEPSVGAGGSNGTGPSIGAGHSYRTVSSNVTRFSQETGPIAGVGPSGMSGLPEGADSSKNVRATHLVQTLARKKQIDLRQVKGSGPRGLITKKDLELHEKKGPRSSAGKEQSPGQAAEEKSKKTIPKNATTRRKRTFSLKKARPEKKTAQIAPQPEGSTQHEPPTKEPPLPKQAPPEAPRPRTESPLSDHQLSVAKNLQKSKTEAPHYYLKTTVWMDRLLECREKTNLPDGTKLSFTAFFIRAAAGALAEFPRMNGSFKDGKIKLFEKINIGFAVSSGEELYVPVIRDADKKSLSEINREVKRLVAKAKNGRLEAEELLGGTFTITNLGAYPVDEFYAVINPPQAGILAFGRVSKSLCVDAEDGIRIRSACSVSASFDHRVVNGAQGAAFLEKCKNILEEEIS